MIGRLNHVAIAVPSLEKAIPVYASMLGAEVSAPQALPEHGVTVVFVILPNTKIELLEPLGAASPIAKFVESNPAGGIHHICYEWRYLAARDHLIGQGARILGDGHRKRVRMASRCFFLHPKDFLGSLVELDSLMSLWQRDRGLFRHLVGDAVRRSAHTVCAASLRTVPSCRAASRSRRPVPCCQKGDYHFCRVASGLRPCLALECLWRDGLTSLRDGAACFGSRAFLQFLDQFGDAAPFREGVLQGPPLDHSRSRAQAPLRARSSGQVLLAARRIGCDSGDAARREGADGRWRDRRWHIVQRHHDQRLGIRFS